jgi:hypothetical protein
MTVFIVCGTSRHALAIATHLRMPRPMWSYVAEPSQLRAARGALVLVDVDTLRQHAHATPMRELLQSLHAAGHIVMAHLAPRPTPLHPDAALA